MKKFYGNLEYSYGGRGVILLNLKTIGLMAQPRFDLRDS